MKLTEPQSAAFQWLAKTGGGWRLWYCNRRCASRVALEALARKGFAERDARIKSAHYYRATAEGLAALASENTQ